MGQSKRVGSELMSLNYFYGYRIVAASSVIQMMYLGCIFAYGVFFPELEVEFGWSRTTISGAASLNFFVLGLFGVAAGSATDRFGPRIVLTICGPLFAVGYLLMHRMASIWELYLFYGLLGGLGMAAHDIATLSTVARWFIRYRGLMSGIVKAGAGIGQVLIPPAAAVLVITYGWRQACLLIGIVGLIVLVVAAQVMRRDPQERGLRPLGDEVYLNSEYDRNENIWTFRKALVTRQFWILCMAKLSDMFCLLTIVTHIVPHGIDQGLTRSESVMVLSTIGGCSILGRLLLGTTFDKLGTKRSLMICFSMLLTSFILLQLLDEPRLLFLFALIYGIAHGGFFVVASPSVAHFFGTRYHGFIFGIVLFVGTLGGTAGPLLAGKIFDVTGSYDIAFLLLTGFATFGLLLTSRLRALTVSDS